MYLKRPLLVLAVGYIIGIVWGLYCNCSIALLYVILFPICYIIKVLLRSKKQFKMFSIKRYFRYLKLILKFNVVLTIILSSLISNTIVKYQNKKYNSLYSKIEEVSAIGIIISNKKEKEYKNVYTLKVESLNENKKYKNTYLYLNINKSLNLEYGDKVCIKGEFVEPIGQRNYKGFNYKEFLKTQKVYGSIKASNTKVIKKECVNTVFLLSNKLFLHIKNNIKKILPKKYSDLLIAIMLGDSYELDENIKQNFREGNISHVLAISGMHITYICLGITSFFNVLFGKRKSRLFTIVILIMYVFITGFSASIVRAVTMAITLMISKIIYRKNDVWSSMSLSILIILIFNPFLILNIGVLLSYGGTIGIIIFYKTFCNLFNRIRIKNRKYKYKLKKFEKQLTYIKETFAISLSVQIVIMPIIIVYFNTISITFLITNLLLSSIITPLIIYGFILILLSIFFTHSLQIVKIPLIAMLNVLIIISSIGKMLPFSKIYVGTPKLWQISLIYVFIFSINFIYKVYLAKSPTSFEYRVRNIVSLIKYRLKQNSKKILSSILVICILVSIIKIIPNDLRVYFIDVGQGDSTLIVTPMNHTILIDGGGSVNSLFDIGKNTLLPYLLSRGITKIDYVIISHMDYDHVGGILTILEELTVKKVIISKQGEISENFEKIKEIVNNKKIAVLIAGGKCDNIQRIHIEKNVYLDILWPNNSKLINENILNNNSIVCKLVYNNFSMLFTGDIEELAERQILQEYKNNLHVLSCSVLKVAHHGAKTSSIQEFLEAVKPKIALIGVGENNNFGHPNAEVLERLKTNNIRIYRTDLNGEISIIISNRGKVRVNQLNNSSNTGK